MKAPTKKIRYWAVSNGSYVELIRTTTPLQKVVSKCTMKRVDTKGKAYTKVLLQTSYEGGKLLGVIKISVFFRAMRSICATPYPLTLAEVRALRKQI